jgi:hypothetical protein
VQETGQLLRTGSGSGKHAAVIAGLRIHDVQLHIGQ